MNPERTPSSKKRLLLIIGVSVILVALSFLITVFVLKSATPHKETTSNTTATGSTTSIDTVLASYPTSIASLQKDYQQQPNGSQSTLYYKQSDKPYKVGVLTTKTVTFTAQTTGKSPSSLSDEITSFFTNKGFTAQDSQKATVGSVTYMVFTNSESACQVATTTPSDTTAQTVTLGCVSLADISKEYSFVDQLLALYTKENSPPSFTQESRNLVTSDNKSLSIVRLTSDSTQLALLFAAVDNQWEYIATLSNGSSTSSNGKFVPSPALTAALNNPKYGDFLKNNIQ